MMTIEQRNAKLDEAKALILAGWSQGAYARDRFGEPTGPERAEAICFCAFGAIIKATWRAGLDDLGPCHRALREGLAAAGYGDNLAAYNDAEGRTKYEVAAIFDRAKEMSL